MRKAILISTALLSCIQIYGKGKKSDTSNVDSEMAMSIKGRKFMLEYQVFERHDETGSTIDTISHPDDYILFSMNGNAYMNYRGKLDSIQYMFPNKKSVSFGDTPFLITFLGNGYYKLYQNEEESNGDYNRVTYILKKNESI